MEPISKIQYRLTDEDNRQRTAVIADRLLAQVKIPRLRVRLFYLLPILVLLLLLALDDAAGNLPEILALAVLAIFILAWQRLFRALIQRQIAKNTEPQKQSGELYLPTEAVFYPDRLTITHARTHSVFPWQEITHVYESADGLCLVHQNYRYLYVPARFFDPNTAFAVTSFLQQIFGRNFVRGALMRAAETHEDVGEVQQPRREEETPNYQFDFVMTGSDTAAVTLRNTKRVLSALGSIFSAGCLWCAVRLAMEENIRAVLVVGLVWLIVMAVGALALMNAQRRQRAVPDKSLSLRWFDDHVTVVTCQEDEAVNQIDYRRLKRVRRQRTLTVIELQDQSFLYVPASAAQSQEQLAEFREFLKEKILKYSKK